MKLQYLLSSVYDFHYASIQILYLHSLDPCACDDYL
jgi:hypothetical protein